MPQIFQEEPWMLVPLVAMVGTLVIILCGLITTTVRRVTQTKQFEQSRREIAAYIAEGSMSPEEGERLLNTKA